MFNVFPGTGRFGPGTVSFGAHTCDEIKASLVFDSACLHACLPTYLPTYAIYPPRDLIHAFVQALTYIHVLIVENNYPDSMTTLAQRWHPIAPLAYGYPLGVLCWPNVGPTMP